MFYFQTMYDIKKELLYVHIQHRMLKPSDIFASTFVEGYLKLSFDSCFMGFVKWRKGEYATF